MYGPEQLFFDIDLKHLILTKPHASLLNQSVVIPGLVCGGHNLFYPLTNIVRFYWMK